MVALDVGSSGRLVGDELQGDESWKPLTNCLNFCIFAVSRSRPIYCRFLASALRKWCRAAHTAKSSLSKAISEQSKALVANQWPSSWGRTPTQFGRTGRKGKHQHRAFPSRWQVLRAASPRPARLKKKCYHSRDTDLLQESKRCDAWAAKSHSLSLNRCFLNFYVKWNFRCISRELVMNQSSAHSFAQFFHHSLVPEWNKGIGALGTNQHFLNQVLCKAGDPSWRPVPEKGVC